MLQLPLIRLTLPLEKMKGTNGEDRGQRHLLGQLLPGRTAVGGVVVFLCVAGQVRQRQPTTAVLTDERASDVRVPGAEGVRVSGRRASGVRPGGRVLKAGVLNMVEGLDQYDDSRPSDTNKLLRPMV